jgi:transcriptional regulator with XRE-family HTH domain
MNLEDGRGETVAYSSLTEQERVVEARRTEGKTYREIAGHMGISFQRVQQIDVRLKAKREGKIPMSSENRRVLSDEEAIKVRDHPLRVLRKQMGYTQVSIAKELKITQLSISKIENNKCSERLLRRYVKDLAAYFEMDENLLLKDTLDWISPVSGNPQVGEEPDYKYLFECQKAVIEAQRQTMVIQQQLLMSKDFNEPKPQPKECAR